MSLLSSVGWNLEGKNEETPKGKARIWGRSWGTLGETAWGQGSWDGGFRGTHGTKKDGGPQPPHSSLPLWVPGCWVSPELTGGN